MQKLLYLYRQILLFFMKKIIFQIPLLLCIITVVANSAITLTPSTQTVCSTGNDSIMLNVNTAAIPRNSQIVLYKQSDSTFNPYNNQGDSIGVIDIDKDNEIDFLNNSCPTILGIFIDACNQDPLLDEEDNEYMIITSGNGFQVSNLGVDVPNGSINGSNADINIGACFFADTFRQTYLDSLRTGFCNTNNLIFAKAGDSIPPQSIVIIFTGNGASFPYNFSEFCKLGVPIYILQNNCFRSSGAFANNDAIGTTCALSTNSRYRLSRILNRDCIDTLIYDRCGLPIFDNLNENEGDGNYVIRQQNGADTASVANNGIQNNAEDRCNGVVADSLVESYKFTYKIPLDLCNDTTYIKAIVKPTTSTGEVVSNTVNFYYACVDVNTNTSRETICTGEQTDIVISSRDPNATFSWTTADGSNTNGETAGTGNSINQTLTLAGNATIDSVTYNITATDNGCTRTTQVKIIVIKAPNNINLGNDTTICGAFSKTLNAGQNANWTRSGNNVGTDVPSITAVQAGTYIATVSNQCGPVSDTLTINQENTPTKPSLGDDTTTCGAFSKTLNAGQNANWTRNGQGIATDETSIIATQAGTYIATISNQCGTVSDTLTINQENIPTIPNLGGDTTICGAFSKTLNAGQNANWTRNGTNVGTNVPSITVTQAGNYVVTISNECGTEQANITISQNPLPFVSLGADTAICDDPIQLTIGKDDFQSIVWSTNETGTSTITIQNDGVYYVTVTDENDCPNSDTIIVGNNCKNEIWVPSAFTPNGDGINDIFYVRGNPKNTKIDKMIIFDRWGNNIFEINDILPEDPTFGWNGEFKGKKQQLETYGYLIVVSFKNGKNKQIKGNVTLME